MGRRETRHDSELHGPWRAIRGIVLGLVAVASTAIAHYAVTGHVPPVTTILLALAITSPVCVALSGVPCSRLRLVGAVLLGQSTLHLLFGDTRATVGDHHHQFLLHTEPSALFTHIIALSVTYVAVRKGDQVARVLQQILRLAFLSPFPEVNTTRCYPSHVPAVTSAWVPFESRPGDNPNPLRGPPKPLCSLPR